MGNPGLNRYMTSINIKQETHKAPGTVIESLNDFSGIKGAVEKRWLPH